MRKIIRTTIILLAGGFVAVAFIQQSKEWKAPAAAKEKKNPIASDETSLTAGKKAFEKECLSCHGKKGKGDGPNAATLEVPAGDLTSAKMHEQADGELFWKITTGRKPMPSAKKALTEDQRWQTVNYIRTFKK